jgi:hypothetical protein
MSVAKPNRFSTLGLNSGYVWWVGNADSPTQACEKSDSEGRNEPRQFVEVTRSQRDRADYVVYAVPAQLTVTDGQDPEQIKCVESCAFMGFFAATGGAA